MRILRQLIDSINNLTQELKNMSSPTSPLAQATAQFAAAFGKFQSDFTTAWPVIQNWIQNQPGGTPPADVQAAITTLSNAATAISTVDADVLQVPTGSSSAPSGS